MARAGTPKRSGKGGKRTSDSSRTPEPTRPVLAGLRAPLADLLAWLAGRHTPHVLIGGVAVGLLARPRATLDIDGIAWVADGDWKKLVADAKASGFTPREKDPIEFIRQTRMLLLRHDASGVEIDLSLGALPFEQAAIQRSVTLVIDGLSIPIPTPEDLIIMKAIAHRPQDMADIDAIARAHPSIDVSVIEQTVSEFAEVLEQPELVHDLRRVLREATRPVGAPSGRR